MEASHYFNKKTILKILLFGLLALILFLSQFVWDITTYFNPDRIQALLSRAGRFAPFAYMLFMALAVVISPIPSLPLDIAAGIFFGPILGTLYSSLGALGGGFFEFLDSATSGAEMDRKVSRRAHQFLHSLFQQTPHKNRVFLAAATGCLI